MGLCQLMPKVDLLHGLKIDLLFIERTESEALWCGK